MSYLFFSGMQPFGVMCILALFRTTLFARHFFINMKRSRLVVEFIFFHLNTPLMIFVVVIALEPIATLLICLAT